MRSIPYLTFNGCCKEAFAFYKEVLGSARDMPHFLPVG